VVCSSPRNEERSEGKEKWESCHGESPMQCLREVETPSSLSLTVETEPDEKERILHSWQDEPNRQHLELAKEASQETTSNVSWREDP
jgi:hypothetical protein